MIAGRCSGVQEVLVCRKHYGGAEAGGGVGGMGGRVEGWGGEGGGSDATGSSSHTGPWFSAGTLQVHTLSILAF